ncbi:TnsA endonuclease N-terminal domain-containing protein [Brevibacillus nitrificans]|uniref:TnsA endonuclease N-terminal domain-containing protein n=1 Tax=Brevibacillus nitrificans TaxID=651560 RepID=UPI001606B8DF|nr:TnsA endonuclease N-terminal domain-containing protein [Brevibacillus nitrificans]
MARKRRIISASTVEKLEKQGWGQGHGKDYIPWLTVRDVPSWGDVNRPKGWITGREHHFLSNLEMSYFYVLDWSDIILDICEQFPLKLERTLEIAKRLGVKHPTIPNSEEITIMTTDFLLDVQENGNIKLFARSVKESDQLNSKRTLEKLEIERQYWQEQGIEWGIITEKNIDSALSKNVAMIHKCRELFLFPNINTKLVFQIEPFLYELLKSNDALSLAELCLRADDQIGLKPSTCLTIVKHLIAIRAWEIDMYVPLDTCTPISFERSENLSEFLRRYA